MVKKDMLTEIYGRVHSVPTLCRDKGSLMMNIVESLLTFIQNVISH